MLECFVLDNIFHLDLLKRKQSTMD